MISLYNDHDTGTYRFVGHTMRIDKYITAQYRMIRIVFNNYKHNAQSLPEIFPYADKLRQKKHEILEELDVFTQRRTDKPEIVEYLDNILEELIILARQKVSLKEVEDE